MVPIEVLGPDSKPTMAELGISKDARTAFIEMAKASGLQLLTVQDRNPMNTSTYGTGQMIRYALERGVTNIIMGIGGSATNDAGAGMAAALGFEFIFDEGKAIAPLGRDLVSLRAINKAKPQFSRKALSFSPQRLRMPRAALMPLRTAASRVAG